MKLKFFICAMVVMCARSASAIKTPSSVEIDDIQKQIYAANRMNKQIGDAEQLLRDAESAKRSAAHINELKKNVAREKEKKNAALTRAIHMTIQAYDLAPANPNGTSVLPLTKGRVITWLPVAREAEARQIQNKSGKLEHQAQPSQDLAGKLYPDGVAYIFPGAFELGVGYLASTLLHERIHFEQMTTKGRGDKMRRAESEVEAYQAEEDNERFFYMPGIPADDAGMAETAAKLEKEKMAAEQVKKERMTLPNRLRDFFGTSAPPDMFESKIHTNAELADISGLVAQARGQADIARREREERDARSRFAAEKTAHDERLKRTYADMAIRSCANPGSVTQAELNSLPVPYQENLQMSGPIPQGLDECATGIYLSLDRGVDAERVRQNSIPKTPADVRLVPPSFPQPARDPVVAVPTTPFRSALPRLKNIAVTACASPAQASIGTNLLKPIHPYSFEPNWEDEVVARLSTGLGDCPRKLFYQLIEMFRSGKVSAVNDRWLQDAAARFTPPVYVAPPPRSSPPTGCIPGDNSRRNCIACGNKNCG